MIYNITFSGSSSLEIELFKRSDAQAYKKLQKLLTELLYHPTTGSGQPKVLSQSFSGYYSRRIDKKNRLVYSIDEELKTVHVLSVKGHYDDK